MGKPLDIVEYCYLDEINIKLNRQTSYGEQAEINHWLGLSFIIKNPDKVPLGRKSIEIPIPVWDVAFRSLSGVIKDIELMVSTIKGETIKAKKDFADYDYKEI